MRDPDKVRNQVAKEEFVERLDYHHIAPGAVTAMLGVQRYVDGCSLEKKLLELAKLRA